jgi:hypothetical protein
MSSLDFSNLKCGNDGVSAGINGTLSSLLNVVGLGALLPNTAEKDAEQALSDATTQMQTETSKWQTVLTNETTQITLDASKLATTMTQAATEQQQVVNEILKESISTNTLMISTLAILVIFLIFYDVL